VALTEKGPSITLDISESGEDFKRKDGGEKYRSNVYSGIREEPSGKSQENLRESYGLLRKIKAVKAASGRRRLRWGAKRGWEKVNGGTSLEGIKAKLSKKKEQNYSFKIAS